MKVHIKKNHKCCLLCLENGHKLGNLSKEAALVSLWNARYCHYCVLMKVTVLVNPFEIQACILKRGS